jgi:hypothetical protein
VTKQRSGENQAVVTPEMIKAGLKALEQWKDLPPGEVMAAVYRAMVAVAPPKGKEETGQPSATVLEVLKRMGH